jgi:hypothetical protein
VARSQAAQATTAGFADTNLFMRFITADSASPTASAMTVHLGGIETPPKLVNKNLTVNPFDRAVRRAVDAKRQQMRQQFDALVTDRAARVAMLEAQAAQAAQVAVALHALRSPDAQWTDLLGCPIALSGDLRPGDTLFVASDFHPEGFQAAPGSRPFTLTGVHVVLLAWCTQDAGTCRDEEASFARQMTNAGAASVAYVTPEGVQASDPPLG